jgi:hypothetical protein
VSGSFRDFFESVKNKMLVGAQGQSPLWVNTKRDRLGRRLTVFGLRLSTRALRWSATVSVLSLIVSSLTLILLGLTVYFAQLRWKEMVMATKASAKAARAATDSVGVAQDTLDASKKAMALDQRAWIGLSEPKLVHNDNGYVLQLGYAINSGKTPARDVHAVMGVYAYYNYATPYTMTEKDYSWIRYILKKAWNLGYHLKTGHTLSVQNRPTALAEDVIVLPCSSVRLQGLGLSPRSGV